MKMRKDKNRPNCYNVEVFTKGILRVTGKRRVDLIIRIIKYGGSDDKEFLLYQSVLNKVRGFLSQKYANFTKVKLFAQMSKMIILTKLDNVIMFQFLPIFESVDIHKILDRAAQLKSQNQDTIFILENKSHMGFKRDLMHNCEGLDYEHSVLGKILY